MNVSYFPLSRVRKAFVDGWRLVPRLEYRPHDYAVLLHFPGDVDKATRAEIARWLEYLMPEPEPFEFRKITRTTKADRANEPRAYVSKNGTRRYTAQGFANMKQGAMNLHFLGLNKRKRRGPGMTQADHEFIDKKLAQMVAE